MNDSTGGLGRITIQDRILLLLRDNGMYPDSYIVSEVLTQAGMSKKLGIRQNNLSRALRDLESRGLIKHRTARVRNQGRKKRAYHLTDMGEKAARDLEDSILNSRGVARITSAELVRWPVRRILNNFRRVGGHNISDLLIENYDGEIFDIFSLYRSPDVLYPRPDIKRFYGRRSELDTMAEMYRDDDNFLISVVGIAGQGKTTLVSRFMEEVLDQKAMWFGADPWLYPENLLEWAAENLALVGYDGLLSKITTAEEPDIRFLSKKMIQEMERSGKPMVIEDLHSANEEMLKFIGNITEQARRVGAEINIMVTSRRRPPIYNSADLKMKRGVGEIFLEGLDLESVGKMVEDMGVTGTDTSAVYRMTKGHPLALELVLGSGGEPGDVEGDLEDYIDGEILTGLTEEGLKVLKLISLLDEPAEEELLLSIERVTHEDIALLLDRLILRRYPDGCLDIHDLVGELVSKRLSEEEKDHYISMVMRYLKGRTETDARLRLMQLLRRAGSEEELALELLESGEPLLEMGYRSVLGFASGVDLDELDPETSARMELLLMEGAMQKGKAALARRHLTNGAVYCTKALRAGRTASRMTLAVDILTRFQRLSVLSGTYNGTVTGLDAGLKFLDRIDGGVRDARIYIRMAETLISMGKVNEARTHLKKADKLVGESDIWEMSRIFLLRGMGYESKNELAKALREYLYLGKISKDTDQGDMRIRSLYRIGRLYYKVGLRDEAFGYVAQSLRSSLKEGDHEMVRKILLDSIDIFHGSAKDSVKAVERARKKVRSNSFRKRSRARGGTDHDIAIIGIIIEVISSAIKGSKSTPKWIKRLLRKEKIRKDPRSYLDLVERIGRALSAVDEGFADDHFRLSYKEARIFENPRLDSLLQILWGYYTKGDKERSRVHIRKGASIASKCGFNKAHRRAKRLLKEM